MGGKSKSNKEIREEWDKTLESGKHLDMSKGSILEKIAKSTLNKRADLKRLGIISDKSDNKTKSVSKVSKTFVNEKGKEYKKKGKK